MKYSKRNFAVGDVISFDYGKYTREGKIVKVADSYLTITYLKLDPSDGAEVKRIKSFSSAKMSGLETLEMAQD
jgi:hypothetical protein